MVKNYTFSFVSLRSGITYTVNIYGGSGTAVALTPAAEPFVTEEDNSEEVFIPLRTQSGYIRIVDENTAGFDWTDLMPFTDVARPVTLTHIASGQTVVDWQGFMQSQNFSGTLYGGKQEREFPIQCPLASAGTQDIFLNTDPVTELKNFAYYLKLIVDYISTVSDGIIYFENVYVQGGTDARNALLNLVDPQCFANIDEDENTIEVKYTKYGVLEDICRYWGWTARTFGRDLYLMQTNGTSNSFTKLTMANLTTMAGGTAAGTTVTVSTPTLGNVFASMSNDITVCRGYSKATVKGDAGNGENTELAIFPDAIVNAMPTSSDTWEYPQNNPDYILRFSRKDTSISGINMVGAATGSGCCFATGVFYERPTMYSTDMDDQDFLLILGLSTESPAKKIEINTVYEHNYAGMILELHSDTYFCGHRVDATSGEHDYGDAFMLMRIGIGKTKETAKWFVENISAGTCAWSNSAGDVRMTIGNKGNKMYYKDSNVFEYRIPVPNQAGFVGKLFVEFYGPTAMVPVADNALSNTVAIVGFKIEKMFSSSSLPLIPADWSESTKEMSASNSNMVQDNWNADCIFCSYGKVKYGFGIISQNDGTLYNIVNSPESKLASRVAGALSGYWNRSKLMYRTELDANDQTVAAISPKVEIYVDSHTCLPIAIGREWRDDVAKIVFIQKP